MAQGTGPLAGDLEPQAPIETSAVTPDFAIPDTASSYEGMAQTFDRLSALAQPAINELATQRGQQMGAAAAKSGQPVHPPLPIGEAGQYLAAGFRSAYLADIHNQVDAKADDLRAANQFDPVGFAKAAQAATSGFIQGSPDEFAVDVENYAQAKFNQAHMDVVEATERKQNREALNSLQERLDVLRPQLRDLAHDGQSDTPDFGAKMTEVNVILGQLVANPAFGLSPDFAEHAKGDLMADLGGASAAGHVMDIYKTQGLGPALDALKALQDDTSLPDEIRKKGVLQAHTELNEASAVDAEISRNANAAQSQAETAIKRQMDDDTASIALTGKGDPTLTEDGIRKVLGEDGVRDWLMKRAKAYGDFRDFGDLSRLPPDQAAQRIAEIQARDKGGSGGNGSVAPGFESAVNFVIDQNEGGSKFVPNDNGRGPTKFGINATANPGVDIENLTRAQAVSIYKSKYWDAIGGDNLPPALAFAAFDAAVNQGVPNAQKWLAQSGGDVTKFLALRRQAYGALLANPANAQFAQTWNDRMGRVTDQVIGLTGGDPNSSAWSAYDAAQQQRRDDPAGAVASDPFVKAEVAKWQADLAAGKHYTGSGFSAVQSYYDAETRAGIKKADQQPLPAAALAAYVDGYHQAVASGDPNQIVAFARSMMREFDDPTSQGKRAHGHQVFQAVLQAAGVSAMAAQNAAVAVQNARTGQPMTPQDRAAMAVATRVDAMHRAANGTGGPAPSVPASDAALLRSAPTPQRQQQFDAVYGAGASARVLHGG
jgi:lysozyme family protein